jgi:hypothetical protein
MKVPEGHAASIFTLKMQSAWPSETLESYHITTLCYNMTDHDMNLHRHENLKYTIFSINWIFRNAAVMIFRYQENVLLPHELQCWIHRNTDAEGITDSNLFHNGSGWRYSSTQSLTSTLDGAEWSASCPAALHPRKPPTRYPLDRRLGGPQSRSGRGGEEKNS